MSGSCQSRAPDASQHSRSHISSLCGRTDRCKHRGAEDCFVKENLMRYIITNSSHYAPPPHLSAGSSSISFPGPASLLRPTSNPLIRLLPSLFIYLPSRPANRWGGAESTQDHSDLLESINITHSCALSALTPGDLTPPRPCEPWTWLQTSTAVRQ